MRLLIIEDDLDLGSALRNALIHAGHEVNWARCSREAQSLLHKEMYDALLLDLSLPGEDGITFLSRLRKEAYTEPVLILTARDAVENRVQGLDAGADDYLVKPFSIDELTARLRALHRRRQGQRQAKLIHGSLVLDPAAMQVTVEERPIELSRREFALLQTLLTNVGRVLSRAELEEALYGWGQDVESNAIEVHIHHLRRKLGIGLIRTIRGVGYLIERRT
jgi:DNA-binding response OmpR family regulator